MDIGHKAAGKQMDCASLAASNVILPITLSSAMLCACGPEPTWGTDICRTAGRVVEQEARCIP